MTDLFILDLDPNEVAKLSGPNFRSTISPVNGPYPTVTDQNIGNSSGNILFSPGFAPTLLGLITEVLI